VTQRGVRHAVIRSGVVLSPHEGALQRLMLPSSSSLAAASGAGARASPGSPGDEVAAIRALIEDEQASGPFNLCAPEPLTNAEFAQVLGG